MEFLKTNRRFDFLYDGVPFSELTCQEEQVCDGDRVTTVYTFADGLKVTNIATKHGGAYEWVNWFENTSDQPTKVISQLHDASVALPMPREEVAGWVSHQPEFSRLTAVYAPTGSVWGFDEFSAFPDRKEQGFFRGQLTPREKKEYAPVGGRSSDGCAPFFNVHKDSEGYIFAIGWTGQWNCSLERTEEDLIVKTKVENTRFRLLPGEKIRTSSFVLMPYRGTVAQGHNQWRALVREKFSLIGQPGRVDHTPLCAMIWGGMRTGSVLDRVRAIRENQLPIEYVWMDAGWYGAETVPSPDEYEGDWPEHTGDWRVSRKIHPGGLKDVAKAVHDGGMKFLLWFEPERVRKETPIVSEHPEYFLFPEEADCPNVLLNLGREDAWNYCVETISGLIEQIGVDGYRQDFNFPPLSYWQRNDGSDRQGITEIKHIMGLYRFWDALLEKFPELIIDNCASGGRRIDIETLRRSVPLWRSDLPCSANCVLEGVQCQSLSYNRWLPYSSTGVGRLYDTYRIRSGYGPGLNVGYAYSEREPFGDDPEKMAWLKQRLDEYLELRPLTEGDFYPLTEVSDRKDIWCVAQYHRPKADDGFVQIFRRQDSPYETARYPLQGLNEEATYVFTDLDEKTQWTVSGKALKERGFAVEITEKLCAKIYRYKKA